MIQYALGNKYLYECTSLMVYIDGECLERKWVWIK